MRADLHRIVGALAAAASALAAFALTRNVASSLARGLLPVAIVALAAALCYAAAGGPGAFRVGFAMLRRTTLTYRSYRVQVVSIFLWTSLTLGLYYMAAGPLIQLLLGLPAEGVTRRLVAFLAVGLTTWGLFWKAWETTALGVRGEQWEGTLESAVPMPNGTRALPVGYLLARLPFTLLFAGLSLTAISLAMPGALKLAAPRAALEFLAVVVLCVVCMWGLGMLFGGLAILYKQVGPVDLVVRTLFLFLGGVFVPVDIFPPWAQALSEALPVTHAYALLHVTAESGIPIGDFPSSLAILMGWTVAAVFAGTAVYHHHVEKARRQGAIQGY